MFKRLLFIVAIFSLLIGTSYAANLKTFEFVGSVANKSHGAVVQEAKKTLSKNFTVIGTYSPSGMKNLSVIILKDKTYLNAVDKAKRNAFFAIPLRVGVETKGNKSNISFLNPRYTIAAFSKKNNVKKAADKEKVKLLNDLKAISGISGTPKEYGYSSDDDSLAEWNMMGKSLYTLNKIGKFKDNKSAKAAVNAALKAKKNGWGKVYEVNLPNAIVIGITNTKYEKEAFQIGGVNHITAFPIELVIKSSEVIALPEMYRMSLYFMDAGMGAFMAHMSMPGSIDDSLSSLLK